MSRGRHVVVGPPEGTVVKALRTIAGKRSLDRGVVVMRAVMGSRVDVEFADGSRETYIGAQVRDHLLVVS